MKKTWLGNILSDQELWLVVVFNLAIFVAYLQDATTASTIVVLYYLQSVFIGIQYFIRLIGLGRMGQAGSGKYGIAFFFLIHYGLFHVVYFVFLLTMMGQVPGKVEFDLMRWLLLALIGNTVLSTISDLKRDKQQPTLAGLVMFQPYLRVVPMHLLIIFGFTGDAARMDKAFLLFVGLKTLADVLMHIIVNKTYRSHRPNATGGWI
ncbi:MAG: hypothetical protein JJ975_04605 [Bacteroidia bacterium]|nr:hypothetical protein [Bacteroidia bacterium]